MYDINHCVQLKRLRKKSFYDSMLSARAVLRLVPSCRHDGYPVRGPQAAITLQFMEYRPAIENRHTHIQQHDPAAFFLERL